MTAQITVRDVPLEDVDVLKREAAARGMSLNSLLGSLVAATAERVRRRASPERTRPATGEVARVAEESGEYVPASSQLLRDDPESR